MYNHNESKLVKVYKDTKERAERHLELLKKAEPDEIVESDRVLQYLQQTIDCLEMCLVPLPKDSESRRQYARYKDELGDLGEEIILLTKPDRW